jgi:hypothetical protein
LGNTEFRVDEKDCDLSSKVKARVSCPWLSSDFFKARLRLRPHIHSSCTAMFGKFFTFQKKVHDIPQLVLTMSESTLITS